MLETSPVNMDRRTLLAGAALFAVLAYVGFFAAFQAGNNDRGGKFSSDYNLTASQGSEIVTVRFDGHSLDLMHEDRPTARFWIDVDRDGSADRELTGLVRDGSVHNTTELMRFNGTDYRFYFRYRDSKDARGDSWIRLFFVEEL